MATSLGQPVRPISQPVISCYGVIWKEEFFRCVRQIYAISFAISFWRNKCLTNCHVRVMESFMNRVHQLISLDRRHLTGAEWRLPHPVQVRSPIRHFVTLSFARKKLQYAARNRTWRTILCQIPINIPPIHSKLLHIWRRFPSHATRGCATDCSSHHTTSSSFCSQQLSIQESHPCRSHKNLLFCPY
jgi:hypothetical protein